METLKATIIRSEKTVVLQLTVNGDDLKINLTDDKPNEVKVTFSKLLQHLKNGEFNFELDDATQDLNHHLSKEYLKQLNGELSSIFKELNDYGLLNDKTSTNE